MRPIYLMVIIIFFISPTFTLADEDSPSVEVESVKEPDKKPITRAAWVHLAYDSFKSDLFKNQAFHSRARLGLDCFMNPSPTQNNWTIGGVISNYTISQAPKITRTDLSLSLGYWLFERRLGFLGHLGTSSTYLNTYYETGGTRYHRGIEIKYRYFATPRVDFFIGAGWMRYAAARLEHNTGQPVTTDTFSNELCHIFTLGLADNCGNKVETLDIPASQMIDLSAGIGIIF